MQSNGNDHLVSDSAPNMCSETMSQSTDLGGTVRNGVLLSSTRRIDGETIPLNPAPFPSRSTVLFPPDELTIVSLPPVSEALVNDLLLKLRATILTQVVQIDDLTEERDDLLRTVALLTKRYVCTYTATTQ